MISKKKLLFVSNGSPDRIIHILDAFENRSDLEVEVEHLILETRKSSFIEKVFYKLKCPLDSDRLNERLLEKVKVLLPDILFIVKGNSIFPSSLKFIKSNFPEIKIVSWSLDDMYAWHNRSLFYTFGLKYYDIVFTSKSYNVSELYKIGAKRVEFIYQAYSRKYHFPKVPCEKSLDVLFIGFAERDRFEYLKFLSDHGINVTVYGSGWSKKKFSIENDNIEINQFDLLGDDYAKAISSAKITLCFLRKINRDIHTSRSVEIPACGGFMLAERTAEHIELFKEGVEAEYFSDKDELLSKTLMYLNNNEGRLKIRNAGLERSKISDYSYDNMAKRILDDL